MNGTLQDKVAVITGGTSGIGLATARLFVEEGAFVFILGRRQKELDEAVDSIGRDLRVKFENWRGRDGNDPSVDIAKDAEESGELKTALAASLERLPPVLLPNATPAILHQCPVGRVLRSSCDSR